MFTKCHVFPSNRVPKNNPPIRYLKTKVVVLNFHNYKVFITY